MAFDLPPGSAPPPEGGQSEFSTWEDDENRATLLLRSAFVLVAGAFLAWAQWHAPLSPSSQWPAWVATAVLCNLALPLGLVWLFLAQGLVYLDWLKDPRHSAWYYGWKLPPWRRHACLALGCWLPLLPFLIYFSRQSDMRLAYQHYLPQPVTLWDWAFLLGTLLVYLFCWEWFFRGFLLFGMAQGMGAIVAILLQATLFGLAHLGKPPVEMAGAFAGGLILGVICWREKSFLPAFSAHALIHVTWAVLVLR